MSQPRIHIVAFDVPFPPDYGGVIDVFNRAKALKEAGYHVVLHCFEYGRGRDHNFAEIAAEVHYYDRKKNILDAFSKLPFIVKSRVNPELLANLKQDDSPILLEGHHCTGFLEELIANDRKVAVRIHNVEWQYYERLSEREKSRSKRLFFSKEAKKLKKDEQRLLNVPLLCITKADTDYYTQLGASAQCTPTPFEPQVKELEVESGFILYQGNLSVAENEEAVELILMEAMKEPFSMPLVIAGKNPSESLQARVEQAGAILVSDPNAEEMANLISAASIHLLIGFQESGLKLKVLAALSSGKSCIATAAILYGTDLHQFCSVWDEEMNLSELVNQTREITSEEREKRAQFLAENYGAQAYVKQINDWLF